MMNNGEQVSIETHIKQSHQLQLALKFMSIYNEYFPTPLNRALLILLEWVISTEVEAMTVDACKDIVQKVNDALKTD